MYTILIYKHKVHFYVAVSSFKPETRLVHAK